MRKLVALLSLLVFFPITHAQDWPQWLGPTRNAAIDTTIANWAGPLQVAWRTAVGEGHSSPIVADGKVFLHDKANDADEEVITAWDLAGKQLWQARQPRASFRSQYGVGPRATPAYAAGKLYTLGVTGIFSCWDAATGKELWKKDLLSDFAANNLLFGVSSSPLVDDKHVYVMPGGEQGSIVAFHRETGDVVWKSGTDKASYSSPMMTTVGGKPLLVFQTEKGVVALEPASGKELFRIPLKDTLNESSTTPVRVGEILFASSVTFGSLGIKLIAKDGQVEATQSWKNARLTCYFGTPIEFDGLLYVVTGALPLFGKPVATLHCVDPQSGTVKWSKKGVGTYHATLLRTKDKLLMLEEKGDLVLVEPSSDGYKEICRSKLCGETWAHPAYAQGLFLIRDGKELVAVRLK